MGKTLADLRLAVASALGYGAVTDLPDAEQADIDTIINAALLECYALPDGTRPKWAERTFSDIAKAPAPATLGLTQGSKVVTGFVFEAKYVGSFVAVGDTLYRLGKVGSGPSYELAQPWAGDTGSYSAKVYYNQIALDATVIEVCEAPTLLGVGPLVPLPNPEAEVGLRSGPAYDFLSLTDRSSFSFPRPRFRTGLLTDVGDPWMYHVDSSSMGPDFATGSRFCLYPIPGAVATFELRAVILPLPMEDPADEPDLPHGADVDIAGAIMMPIMFDLLLKHPLGRRYAGKNGQLMMANADAARARLKTFARVQKRFTQRATVARGW